MIDTQEIRKRILSLALTGKLVEQNSSDTPAHELVESLSDSLNNHSFENDISTKEIPYEIPDSWVWCRLSDIGTTNIGLTYHPQDVAEDGTIVIRSSNIIKGKMDYADLVKVKCQIRENQYLKRNDIVICARNGSKALVGKCAIYEGDPDVISFGAFMAIFRTPFFQYAYLYFNSPVFRRNFSNDDSKQINQVTQNILKNSLIPIPPEEEQKRITDKINSVFSILDTIDTLQSQYQDNLATLKSKIIDAGIQGKLTEQLPEDGTAEELYQELKKQKKAIEDSGILRGRKKKTIQPINGIEVPFDIPTSWKWIRLDDIAEIFGRIGFRGYKKSDIVEEGQGALSLSPSNITIEGKCIYDKCTYITWEKYNESPEIMVSEEDIVLVKTGSSYGKCGIIKYLPEKATINPQLALLKYILCDRYYLHLVLNSTMARKQYSDFVVGAATPTFSQEDLANLIIPLPPLAEQKRIVAKLEQLLSLCEG